MVLVATGTTWSQGFSWYEQSSGCLKLQKYYTPPLGAKT